MKKKFVKKSLAWLLALMMVITFMPTGVFADEGDVPEHSKVATENGDGTYTCTVNNETNINGYTALTAPIVIPSVTNGIIAA